MNPPPEVAFRVVHQMPQARAFFRRSDFARDAGVIQRRHVNQETPRQRDVAGDARALLAQRLLGDLDDDFLALLQHVRDQLRAARLLRTPMAVSTAVPVLRTPSAIIAPATAIAAATARGILHARAEIVAHARLERSAAAAIARPLTEIAPPSPRHRRRVIATMLGPGFALREARSCLLLRPRLPPVRVRRPRNLPIGNRRMRIGRYRFVSFGRLPLRGRVRHDSTRLFVHAASAAASAAANTRSEHRAPHHRPERRRYVPPMPRFFFRQIHMRMFVVMRQYFVVFRSSDMLDEIRG